MSPSEEVAGLKSQIEELKNEKEAAIQRASTRHQNMMHANRRAERAEQALEKESSQRRGEKANATNLFCSYKETIRVLKLEITRAQQAGPSNEQLHALQAPMTAVEAVLVEQLGRVQDDAEAEINRLRAEMESNEKRAKSNAGQYYQTRLEEWKKQFLHEQQACKAENASLKQQLQQATKMIEWQKKQMQQQTAERLVRQGQPGQQKSAGISAGFQLPPKQSPAKYQDTANKRRRLDSMGHAGVPTPDLQRSRKDPIRSNAFQSTPKRKALAETRERDREQYSQQPATPSRPNTPSSQPQRPVGQESPAQHPYPSRGQLQSLSTQLQDAPRTKEQFSTFYQQLNIQRLGKGQHQLAEKDAFPLFYQWVSQKSLGLSAIPSADKARLQRKVQHSGDTGFNLGGKESPSTAVRSPFQPSKIPSRGNTPPVPVGTQSPFSSQTAGTFQNKQSQQLQRAGSQSTLQASAMLNSGLGDGQSPFLTGQNAALPVASNDGTIHTQSAPQVSNGEATEMDFESQLALQLQVPGNFSFLEDSKRTQDKQSAADDAQTHSWSTTELLNEGNTLDFLLPSTEIDSLDFSNDFPFDDLPSMTGAATPSAPFTHPTQTVSNDLTVDNGTNPPKQQHHPQQDQNFSIDPALLFMDNTPFPPPSLTTQHPSNQYYAPLPAATNPPPTHARKYPAQAPGTRSTRSTPAPSAPVIPTCLACHENWWNTTCDASDPCNNCALSGTTCERPRCIDWARGTCARGAKCPRVHEGDMQFTRVVVKPKTLKRMGKKDDRKASPVEVARGQRV